MSRLNNMVRFITSVISGDLKVSNRKRAEVLAELQEKGFDKLGGTNSKKVRGRGYGEGCFPTRHSGM